MIFDKWKAIFIHVPRTGGGSVESTLLLNYFNFKKWREIDSREVQDFRRLNYHHPPNWTQHLPLKEREKHIPKDKIDSYFKFAFVRNPWDRVLSEYLYIKKEGGCNCKEDDKRLNTFKEYLKNFLACSWEDHALPQKDLILNAQGNIGVDFVGRFENLQNDFNFVANRIGLKNTTLPRFNETRRGAYTQYYNNETRQIVKEIYKKDIEYFGYKFGE